MIFVNWFGWSILWLLPLLLRTVVRALARKPLMGGRGAIRLWGGTLLLLLASSGLEALLRAQLSTGDEGPQADLIGAALLTALGGKLSRGLAAVLLLGLLALGLKWLFGGIFSRASAAEREEHHPELDLGPPRRGSIESERFRSMSNMNSQRTSFPSSSERRMPAPRAASGAASSGAASRPPSSPFPPRARPSQLTPPPARAAGQGKQAGRDDWKVSAVGHHRWRQPPGAGAADARPGGCAACRCQ